MERRPAVNSQPRTQLMLALDRKDPFRPVTQPSTDLVQALADLLLEALGARTPLSPFGQEASDEPEDHA